MTKKTITCSCGEKLTREDVKYSQNTDILYNVSFDKDDYVKEYDEYDRVCGDGGEFFCLSCGEMLCYEDKKKLKINE